MRDRVFKVGISTDISLLKLCKALKGSLSSVKMESNFHKVLSD